MTRTEELLKLAASATSGPWDTNPADALSNELEVTANNNYVSVCDAAPYDALFIAATNPETIKQLVELVRLQNSAVKWAQEELRMHQEDINDELGYSENGCPTFEAIEAFNKWEGK